MTKRGIFQPIMLVAGTMLPILGCAILREPNINFLIFRGNVVTLMF